MNWLLLVLVGLGGVMLGAMLFLTPPQLDALSGWRYHIYLLCISGIICVSARMLYKAFR